MRAGGEFGSAGFGGADIHVAIHERGVHADDLERQGAGKAERAGGLAAGGGAEQQQCGGKAGAGGGVGHGEQGVCGSAGDYPLLGAGVGEASLPAFIPASSEYVICNMMEALQPALQAMPSSTFLRSWRRFLCLLAVLVLFSPLPATHARADPPPALMLAGRWQEGLDPSAYWVSEKLDGVRAYWDGQRLRFRSGRPIAAPAWFTAGLPARALDGELWLGRGRFAELSGLVRREAGDDRAWQQVRYMIFDLPGEEASFELRLRRLHEVIAAAALPWVQAVPQFRVDDEVALAATLARVVAGGGEGLMLHRADARWQAGRSDALLKLTPFLDAEARVVAHLPGKGRHAGVLGALELESADGRRFRVGTGLSDAQRREPPAIGSLVSYRYRELTAKGMPRFPVFLRVRSPGAD